MTDYPEGSIHTEEGLRELVRRAKIEPFVFYTVCYNPESGSNDTGFLRVRWADDYMEYDGRLHYKNKAGSLKVITFRDQIVNKKFCIFTNFWLAWAWAQKQEAEWERTHK